MRIGEENFYRDPETLKALTLVDPVVENGEVILGALVSESGNRF